MKVYKTTEYPNEPTFLELVTQYREYIQKRRLTEIVQVVIFPQKVVEYGEILEQAQKLTIDPEPLEFIELTEEEEAASLQQVASQEAAAQAEQDAIEQRISDVDAAITDVEFRESFIMRELQKEGYSNDVLLWKMFRHLFNNEVLNSDFDEIKTKRRLLETEIQARANTLGVTYVEA